MKSKSNIQTACERHIATLLLRAALALLCVFAYSHTWAQTKKKGSARSITSSLPSDYTHVDGTLLYYSQGSNSTDFIGQFDSRYYSSTYSDSGYKLAIQVGDGNATIVNQANGTTVDGVTCIVSVLPQGELAKVVYTVTNNNAEDVSVSLGTHADVMIGSNDRAPISRKIDPATGNTYGLSLKDGNGAELCVLFGSGLAGVNAVSDFWFGYYSQNNYESSMVGNYSAGSNYMEENGSYDSGMGWCWKNRTIAPQSSVEFSYLIGVGDVTLEPSSSFEVKPDDPVGWNDLSRPHRLTLNGTYESPAGIDGIIEYRVEESGEWTALTDTLQSGQEFTASLVAMFNAARAIHTIEFRITDAVGNTSNLHPIEYTDVSYLTFDGIHSAVYTGDSIYQESIVCDLEPDHYTVTNYTNNVNASAVSGSMASFSIEGVFPYTIGRRRENFEILPADIVDMTHGIELINYYYSYTGEPIIPEWRFVDMPMHELTLDVDYNTTYGENIVPGDGSVTVTGIGNYTGECNLYFTIDKATLENRHYGMDIPESDICFDGNAHDAHFYPWVDGIGLQYFTYFNVVEGTESTEAPTEEGNYDIYLTVNEGDYFYGLDKIYVGSFSIYRFVEDEWNTLCELNEMLVQNSGQHPWNMSQGITGVSTLDGLVIRQGHVVGIDLSYKGLMGDFPWPVFRLPLLEELNFAGNSFRCDIGEGMQQAVAGGTAVPTGLLSIDISDNLLYGNIGQFAALIPSLRRLHAYNNGITDVIPALSADIAEVDISGQKIERALDINLKDMFSPEVIAKLPTIIFYDSQNRTYRQDVNLLISTSENYNYYGGNPDEWAIIMRYDNGIVSMPYMSEQNYFYGENGGTLYVFDMNDNAQYPNVNTFKMNLTFSEGDANFSGDVDVIDLQAIILGVFDSYRDLPFNFTAADIIKDSRLNVQDVVGEVNLLLAMPYPETTTTLAAMPNTRNNASAAQATVYCKDNKLTLYTTEPVATFDIWVDGATAVGVTGGIEGADMNCVVKNYGNRVRLIGYSLSGGYIPAGETAIATITGSRPSVGAATLSDRQAGKIATVTNQTTSGISTAETSEPAMNITGGRLTVDTGTITGDAVLTVTTADGQLISRNVIHGGGTYTANVSGHGVIIVNLKAEGTNITRKLTNN